MTLVSVPAEKFVLIADEAEPYAFSGDDGEVSVPAEDLVIVAGVIRRFSSNQGIPICDIFVSVRDGRMDLRTEHGESYGLRHLWRTS